MIAFLYSFSWCGPCRKENPNVVKVYSEYKDKGFDVFGVSLDASKEPWLKAIEKDHLTWTHVGFYLIDDGQDELFQALKIKKTVTVFIERLVYKHPLFLYAGGIVSLSLIAAGIFIKILHTQDIFLDNWKMVILSFVFLLCVSQLVVDLVNWLSMLLIKPKILPRLDFSEGIPSENATMVVIPTMLSNIDAIEKLIDNMELHYLSNRDENIHFALLTDFLDAQQETMPFDNLLLEQTKKGIERLNKKYTSTSGISIFYLFHRPRRWNSTESKWIGYERKRGKLMDFNAFLRGGASDAFSKIIGDQSALSSIKYVITLDTDTQLPGNTAHKLIGTMLIGV